VTLPGGMDPMDVVGQVRRNREGMIENRFQQGPGEATAEVDPAFQVGVNTGHGTAMGSQNASAVAFDGTNYLVVWADRRNDHDYDIYGTRVSPAGSVLDPAGIRISIAAGDQEAPAVAFDGTRYLVVWQDYRSGSTYDIYGARVSTAGTVVDASGIAVTTAANSQQVPDVAFDGARYLVVWQDYRSGSNYDIYGARVSTAGTVFDPSESQ